MVVDTILYILTLNTTRTCLDTNGARSVYMPLLEDKRADPAADNNQAITFASQKGHPEVVRLLLEDNRVYETVDYDELL